MTARRLPGLAAAAGLALALAAVLPWRAHAQPAAPEGPLSALDPLTRATWVAEGEGFSTTLRYRWLMEGRVLEAANEVRAGTGEIVARYRGAYLWDPADSAMAFWTAAESGELHRGRAWWRDGVLWHEATVSGGGMDAYASALRVEPGVLRYYAEYGGGTATSALLAAEPLVYRPAPAVSGATSPDSTLRALEFLIGSWRIPADATAAARPDPAEVIIMDAEWVVGGKAIRLREYVRADGGDAELEGLVYWDTADERIEMVAVGGSGPGQGRVFHAVYTPLPDGRVEKVYDVWYRTPADVPGEELGGLHRRFREILEPAGADGLEHTLEWWRDGRWQPFGQGRYRLERAEIRLTRPPSPPHSFPTACRTPPPSP